MARPPKYTISLTEELKKLKSVIRKKETSKTIRSRCQIILDLDEAHGKVLTHEQSAKSNGVCMATVTNTVTKYMSGGIDAVTCNSFFVDGSNLEMAEAFPVLCLRKVLFICW